MAEDEHRDAIVPSEPGWREGKNGGRLRAWGKGQTGNPNGVSRKRLIAKELNAILEKSPQTVRRIAETLIEGACAGDAKMMAILLDRTDGLVEREAAEALPMIEVIVQGAKRELEASAGSGSEGTPLSGSAGDESRTESGAGPNPASENEVREVEVLRLPSPDDDDYEEDDDG